MKSGKRGCFSKALSFQDVYNRYLIMTNPATSRMTKTVAKMLKYLSIKVRMLGPKMYINPPTKKNRADREIMDAMTNTKKLILNAPAEIVKTL